MIWIFVLAITFGVIFFLLKRRSNDNRTLPMSFSDESLSKVEETSNGDDEQYNDNYWLPVESTKRKVAARLKIRYQKTNNVINERVFDVSSFSRGEGGFHIHGYCHRRKKNITLSSLGILEAVDIESGELIGNINDFLEEKYKGTTASVQDALFDDYGWALYMLIYLAATSGSVVKKERDVIAQYIKSIPKFSSLEDSWIDETLKDLYRPGKMEIRNWVKSAIENGSDFSVIKESVEKLETMQKKENKEFWTFKKYVEKQLTNQNAHENA